MFLRNPSNPNHSITKRRFSPLKLLTVFLLLQDAVSFAVGLGSKTPQYCAENLSPQAYDWSAQCPANPATQSFISSKKVASIYDSYLVYSNYPLTHVQIYLIGGEHAALDSEITHDNHKRASKLFTKLGKPGDLWSLEGMANSTFKACKSLSVKHDVNFFPKKQGLLCTGWEDKKSHALAVDLVTTIYSQYNKSIMFIAPSLFFIALSMCMQWYYLKDPVNFRYANLFSSTVNGIFFVGGLYFILSDSMQPYRSDNYNVIVRINRNQNMIYNIDAYTDTDSHNKMFITAGTLHFFTKKSMMLSDDETADLRNFLLRKEAAGHPVAYLYPHNDEWAEDYNKEIMQTFKK